MNSNNSNSDALVHVASVLREIHRDIKALEIRQADQNTLLKINTASLELHMARTKASEDRIQFIERFMMTVFFTGVVGGLVKYLFLMSS